MKHNFFIFQQSVHLDSGIKMKPTTCFLLTGLTFTALTGVITGCDNKETDSGIDNNIETLSITMPFQASDLCPQGGIKTRDVPDINGDGMISKEESADIDWSVQCNQP
tara:strand:- start:348 stop:671 length:324 start_codon:yes stop_codon:yes gene_type:complete